MVEAAAQSVPDEEVAASIGLGSLPHVGPRTVRRWLEQAGSAAAAWRSLRSLTAGRRDADEIVSASRAFDPAAMLRRCRERGISVLALLDPAYPARLRAIPDPPAVLYVRGTLDERPAVAIVGSRRATAYGRAATGRMAADLAAAGVTIVSGLARGIDGAAHQAALDAEGHTVAVLGCGIDVLYPREHRRLAEAIAAAGALVSEFAPGTPPLPGHFPRRNRVISGLALGVVVVEGAEDSGALVTVDYALEQGREVFAVPGSIFSVKSRAPHELLRQGARIAERADDVLDELKLSRPPGAPVTAPARTASDDEARLLAFLDAGPRPLDEVIEASAWPAARVAALVTVLEVRGLIRCLPGQMVMRTPGKAHGSSEG
ncbi:MAG: DNA-processing protein DprA [Armatimonadota bacterium]|nr:DNA-processing protein DprA [Armatimonadota bacterium]